MDILILDTYYPAFLRDFYRGNAAAGLPYREARQRLLDQCFGVSDFYSRHLRENGFEAEEVIANCAPLQLGWAREHDFRANAVARYLPQTWPARSLLVDELLARSGALHAIVAEQIRRAKPAVLFAFDLSFIPPALMRTIKPHVKLVVGQIASPLPP